MRIRLTLPNLAATLMMSASTFADAWLVGRLGAVALASLALGFPFQTLMIMMCGGAVTSALARALGRDDAAGAALVRPICIAYPLELRLGRDASENFFRDT